MKKSVLLLMGLMLFLCGCSNQNTDELCPEYFIPIVKSIESYWTDNYISSYLINCDMPDYDEGLENSGYEENGELICCFEGEYITFDAKKLLTESDEWQWNVIGFFREENENKVYVCWSDWNRWGEEIRSPQLILSEFDADNTEEYQVIPYNIEPADIFSDSGGCYRIGDNIYIMGMEHTSATDELGVINLETKQLRYCRDEYTVTEKYAEKIIDAIAGEKVYSMNNFRAMLEQDDVTVFGANISDGFDACPVGMIFAAFKDNEPIAYMSVDLTTDGIEDGLKIEVLDYGNNNYEAIIEKD